MIRMAEIKRRVYSPRGERGGGGLVAQVTIDEADVQRWLGEVGSPSAMERASVGRAVSWALTLLARDVTSWLGQREAEVVAAYLADREVAGVASIGSSDGQPGDIARDGTNPANSVSTPTQVMATAGPISQGTEGDPT